MADLSRPVRAESDSPLNVQLTKEEERRRELLVIRQNVQKFDRTYVKLLEFLTVRFGKHCEEVKEHNEATTSVEFIDKINDDGNFIIGEIRIPKEPTEYLVPDPDMTKKILSLAARSALTSIVEKLETIRERIAVNTDEMVRTQSFSTDSSMIDLQIRPGCIMIELVIQIVLDDWMLFEILYKTIVKLPIHKVTNWTTLLEYINYRVHICSTSASIITEETRERKAFLKEFFMGAMIEDELVTPGEFGLPVSKSAGKL